MNLREVDMSSTSERYEAEPDLKVTRKFKGLNLGENICMSLVLVYIASEAKTVLAT